MNCLVAKTCLLDLLLPRIPLMANHIYIIPLTKIVLIFGGDKKCDFRVIFPSKISYHSTPFMTLSPPGTHFTAESTEAMRTKCLAQGHNILMQSGLNRRSMHPETDVLRT